MVAAYRYGGRPDSWSDFLGSLYAICGTISTNNLPKCTLAS
jgi:hypothetical protein